MVNIEEQFTDSLYPVKQFGAELNTQSPLVILLHGRRQTVDDMFKLSQKINLPGACYLQPCAPEATWYPRGFMRDVEDNQPFLSDALSHIDNLINYLVFQGVKKSNIWLMGFSQGACIAAEFMKQYQHRLAGAIMFTGGLFGRDDPKPEKPQNVFHGMPILVTGSKNDSWVPEERVKNTAKYFAQFGADVHLKVFAEREHYVSKPEIELAKELMTSRQSTKDKEAVYE
jgi:phospholipase/carboxylesterase